MLSNLGLAPKNCLNRNSKGWVYIWFLKSANKPFQKYLYNWRKTHIKIIYSVQNETLANVYFIYLDIITG